MSTTPSLPRLALFLSNGRKVPFPSEMKTLIIGREEDSCDLVLPGKSVSSKHCYLRGGVLHDTSSFGTKVNGEPIKELELRLGDTIKISHHTVKVVLFDEEPSPTSKSKTKPPLPKPETKTRRFPKFSGEISFYELVPPKFQRKERYSASCKEVIARRGNSEIAIARQSEDYTRILDSLADSMPK
mmetsp:Transcript_34617/g.48208  ORF Transcript_34617/g.48208 Transcript_34617/m.48208 type:complete len:185 (+) Transcript_34617:166-720(+)|eukprot:CAMPEP_0185279394 /NCGR_PEP_ID=MMETSP1359-20130426/63438_1 /TAXON_ID=552665 /ORGANISM="Bigelowiella longifila, Strain CCMP242" /LENGTH=184 /DNA_ID=CAMNT_0027874265 /DNA_START=115 /DNA_END=669 /DNA_ORIENTATION=+